MSSNDNVLDRSKSVLLVIDIQDRLVAAMARRNEVVARSTLLIKTAGIVGLPVIVTRQYPKGLGEIDAELLCVIDAEKSGGTDVTFSDKVCFDCFREPAFADIEALSGRDQLLICGMETHICITQTALAAHRAGFEVHVAGDATCSRDDRMHELALRRLGHAGVVVTTAESAAYELIGRAGSDDFKALLSVVKGQNG